MLLRHFLKAGEHGDSVDPHAPRCYWVATQLIAAVMPACDERKCLGAHRA